MSDSSRDSAELLRRVVEEDPGLADRLARQLLTLLHTKGLASLEGIYEEARRQLGQHPPAPTAEEDPNRPSAVLWEKGERDAVREITFRLAAERLPPDLLRATLDLVRHREEADSLENLASLPGVPFKVLAHGVRRFLAMPGGEEGLPQAQAMGLRVSLTRDFISDQLEFIGVAKNYLRISDFQWILERVIGPERGQGRIGGKAAGMYLGYKILERAEAGRDGAREVPVRIPESWFLRSDVIDQFLRHNRLEEYHNQKYKSAEEIRNEYPVIRQAFRNAEFPPDIVQQLERVLDEVGHHPLVVRSSSLLEDRFGAAFSGMYASVFLGNQADRRQNLQALLGAIAEVFASTLGPDPLLYRRRHNLVDYNEEMGVLLQKVVGVPYGPFFLPDLAGVAFSRNEYRWSPRIRSEDGMARLVFGLGTRAVDRTGNDYPRLVALGAPRLRPEVTPDQVRRYSQKFVDLIDLEEDRFRSADLSELLRRAPRIPVLDLAASLVTEDEVVEPTGGIGDVAPERVCLTFDRLLARTRFAPLLRDRLRRLEDAYGTPINVEFAQSQGVFYLLQCRPLVQAEAASSCRLPQGVPPENVVFTAKGLIRSGDVRQIEYVVLVDPWEYETVGSVETRMKIGRAVARINDALEGRTFLLMGPGRWGSNDSRLGVRVHYADISHCRALVEIAVSRGGFVPEVSYGTHFFQDLVEDGIFYLALYPEEEGTVFREWFFRDTPNAIGKVSPQDEPLGRYVRVISVSEAAPGRSLHLVMDGEAGEAMCWLE
jgi:hypothetical protein